MPGIGKVQNRVRFFTERTAFEEFHVQAQQDGSDILNSVTVVRAAAGAGSAVTNGFGESRATTRLHTFEMTFIRGQHDETESAIKLDELFDAVFDHFESKEVRAAFRALNTSIDPIEATSIGIAGYLGGAILVNQIVARMAVREH